MLERIKQDNFYLGMILGFILPGIVLAVLAGINEIIATSSSGKGIIDTLDMVLISIFSNLFLLRYYMVNLKYDKTGRGVLLITFAMALVCFYYLFRN